MQTIRDPRETITPLSFAIAPALLGRPLARPWRRAAAMLVDLLLVAILVGLLEEPSILFGALVAVFLFRLTGSKAAAPGWPRMVRGSLRLVAAIIVFAIGIALWHAVSTGVRDAVQDGRNREGDPAIAGDGRLSFRTSLTGAGVALSDLVALARAATPEEARAAATRITDRVRAADLSPEEIAELRGAIEESSGMGLGPLASEALLESLRSLESGGEAGVDTAAVAPVPADSLVLALAAVLGEGDVARADTLRRRAGLALARDTLAALERRNAQLGRRVGRLAAATDALEDRFEEEREGMSLTRLIRATLDDLGIGFGWMALYFTTFLTVWKGRTPGKRLLRIRVIRLDGKPIGWWAAFERFGGYGAALVTGLLGFAQILWDRNRQGIHDKISETVVALD